MLNAGWRRGGWHPAASPVPRSAGSAQRRVASWGVARENPTSPAIAVASAQRRVASWGVAQAEVAKVKKQLEGAQRRVASWGVAPNGRHAAQSVTECSTPGGVVGGGTSPNPAARAGRQPVLNAGWRRGGWHAASVIRPPSQTRAQRRVASWGVAPTSPVNELQPQSVLNAGWRRGGWHTPADVIESLDLPCSTPGGVVGGGTCSRALKVMQRRMCSTPGGVVGGGTTPASAWARLRALCSTPGGVVGGGTLTLQLDQWGQ